MLAEVIVALTRASKTGGSVYSARRIELCQGRGKRAGSRAQGRQTRAVATQRRRPSAMNFIHDLLATQLGGSASYASCCTRASRWRSSWRDRSAVTT
jgi:hypothetical protein